MLAFHSLYKSMLHNTHIAQMLFYSVKFVNKTICTMYEVYTIRAPRKASIERIAIDSNYNNLCLYAETDMTDEDVTQMEEQLPMLYYSQSTCIAFVSVLLLSFLAFTTYSCNHSTLIYCLDLLLIKFKVQCAGATYLTMQQQIMHILVTALMLLFVHAI